MTKLGALFFLAVAIVFAMQTAGKGFAQDDAEVNEVYVPMLGDSMLSIQMRHIKLWLAGSAKNWQLAGYELGEIEEVFEDAARFNHVFKGMPVADMIKKITARPLKDLGAAIEAKDASRFDAAFDGLTAACNECHRSAGHGFIMIKRPKTSPFSDQVFSVKSR